MSAHIAPLRLYLAIWLALMVLLVVTVGVAQIDFGHAVGPRFGWLNLAAALTVAVVKAVLVVLYFMHVRWSSRLTQVFVIAGFIWLGILFTLTFSDYLARGWYYNDSIYHPRPGEPMEGPGPRADRPPGLSPARSPNAYAPLNDPAAQDMDQAGHEHGGH